jgi:hypothetical protein
VSDPTITTNDRLDRIIELLGRVIGELNDIYYKIPGTER